MLDDVGGAGPAGETPAFPNRLAGKNILVTAAAQGIGRASALRFAAEGAKVTAVDINAAVLSQLKHPNIETSVLDAADGAAIKAFTGESPQFDVLLNAVGRVHQGTILDVDDAEWALSFKLNIEAYYHTIKALLPAMLARRRGSIINIASVASSLRAVPNRAVYSATKAAVIGLTKSIAIDFAPHGVRCNAISPGTIATPSLDERINSFADPVAARAAFIDRQPMRRLGEADEIAALCAYLASDESAFMTGAVLTIDGGMTA